MEAFECGIHQVFVKLLDGKHKILNFETSLISVSALKHRIQSLTSLPSHHQLLLSNNSQILRDDQSLTLTPSTENPLFSNSVVFQFGEGKFPMVVHLLLRLRGGKGGFGSLLRGAATKAGQKKTNNFDACRDMSGRRLRHVNAEKKLEEWRAEAEERKLEKMAEDFLKKNAKEVAQSGKRNGGDSSEKYVAKYREQSAKCMEEVEKSVRESVKEMLSSKRKGGFVGKESDSKRLKIWLGKRKFGESESDCDSEDGNNETEEGENEKSVVIDNGSQSDSRKEADRSSGSTTGRELETGSHDQDFSGSSSEEEDIVVEKSSISGTILDGIDDALKSIGSSDPVLESLEKIVHEEANTDSKKEELIINPLPSDLASELDTCAGLNSTIQSEAFQKESVSASGEAQELDKPLNFDEYHSAAELEVLGMERLKSELQAQGLKCGGTLPERAARLFLLKTMPLDNLPKKLLAKK